MLAAFAFGAGNNALAASTASQTLRPSYVDLSSTTSPGAVLMTLSGYTAGSAPKYRLYNGSSQYNCWDAASGTFISSTTYSDGPTAPGDYVNGTTFWILYQRGNNNSVTASYRDRVSPYSVNNNTVSLSAATAMSSPFNLTGTVAAGGGYDLTVRYVVLGFDSTSGGTLLCASFTDLTTGNFTLVCHGGTAVKRVEFRTISNTTISAATQTGTWSTTTALGTISLGAATTYTVTYDANGGSGAPTDPNSPYTSGATVTVLGAGSMSRAGYTFTGWNTQAGGGGTSYSQGNTFTITQNTTLYAQWTINTYTVTYDANGGSGAPTDPNSPYNYNSTVTVLGAGSMSRAGYTFTGWNTQAGGGGTSYSQGNTFSITANTTLYAQWTAASGYSVSYHANGGSGAPTDPNNPYSSGASVTVLGAGSMTRTGYSFAGWNTQAGGGGTPYSGGNTFNITADTTLYAQWTINTYTVTYDNNGGTGSQTDSSSPYNYNSTVTVLGVGTMAKTGYTFAGWNTAANGSGTPYSAGNTFTIAANTTLYAQWKCAVTYDNNSGTGSANRFQQSLHLRHERDSARRGHRGEDGLHVCGLEHGGGRHRDVLQRGQHLRDHGRTPRCMPSGRAAPSAMTATAIPAAQTDSQQSLHFWHERYGAGCGHHGEDGLHVRGLEHGGQRQRHKLQRGRHVHHARPTSRFMRSGRSTPTLSPTTATATPAARRRPMAAVRTITARRSRCWATGQPDQDRLHVRRLEHGGQRQRHELQCGQHVRHRRRHDAVRPVEGGIHAREPGCASNWRWEHDIKLVVVACEIGRIHDGWVTHPDDQFPEQRQRAGYALWHWHV